MTIPEVYPDKIDQGTLVNVRGYCFHGMCFDNFKDMTEDLSVGFIYVGIFT